jgi:hypothetical protein
MFWEASPAQASPGSSPLSFKLISDRLSQGGSADASSWVSDVRRLLMSAVLATPELSVRNAAARQLQSDFESEMATLSPTLSPHVLRLQLAEGRLKRFVDSPVGPIPEIPTILNSPPAGEIMKRPIESDSIVSAVKMLASPALVLRVAAFVHQIQPEAIQVGSELTILFSVMSESTLQRVCAFVHGVMYEAAVGAIQPFVRTPGKIGAPAVVDRARQ